MSGTAKEAERAQELRRRAAKGDEAAEETLDTGENTPFGGDEVEPKRPGLADQD